MPASARLDTSPANRYSDSVRADKGVWKMVKATLASPGENRNAANEFICMSPLGAGRAKHRPRRLLLSLIDPPVHPWAVQLDRESAPLAGPRATYVPIESRVPSKDQHRGMNAMNATRFGSTHRVAIVH